MNITGCLKRRSRALGNAIRGQLSPKDVFGGEAGFTLIELLVVILIIGILVAIAIPQYFKVAERSRIGDAMNFISSVKQSQERYLAKNGNYLTTNVADITNLDISYAAGQPSFGMRNWTVTGIAANVVACAAGGWSMVLTRCTVQANGCDSSNARYGGYTLTYDSCSGAVPNPYGAIAAVNADLL